LNAEDAPFPFSHPLPFFGAWSEFFFFLYLFGTYLIAVSSSASMQDEMALFLLFFLDSLHYDVYFSLFRD